MACLRCGNTACQGHFFDNATRQPVDLAKEIARAAEEHSRQRIQWLEALIRVHLDSTGDSINDVELVEETVRDDASRLETRWWIRRRT